MHTKQGFRVHTKSAVTFLASAFLFLALFIAPKALADAACEGRLDQAENALLLIGGIQAEEASRGVTPEHQTRAHVHTRDGKPVKTPVSIVITHGLLNSPAWMESMAKQMHAMGFNVINSRLTSHWEGNRRALDGFKASEALAQGERVADIAQQLGNRVIYIGHSTGGSLSIYNALNNISTTAGLILFSPALRVSDNIRLLSSGLSTIGISGWLPEMFQRTAIAPLQRYSSTYAGVEVDAMANALAEMDAVEDRNAGEAPYGLIRQRLNSIPILWFDTEFDKTVDITANADVADTLAKTTHVVYPLALQIEHNMSYTEPQDLTTPAGQMLDTAKRLWVDFLKRFQ